MARCYVLTLPGACASSPAAGLTCRYPCLCVLDYEVRLFRGTADYRLFAHTVAVPRPAGIGRVWTYDGSNRSPLARIAHRIRACLFATATHVRDQPMRACSCTIQRDSRSSRRGALVTAERAP